MQALLAFIVPGELLTATPWLWFDAIAVLLLSGLLLVVLNIRVHSALGDDTKGEDGSVSASLLSHLCWYPLFERFVRRQRVSTARLHIRVDDVSDTQVTSSQYQMVAESLSYIIALSLGAALTASLPAVPSDAAQYNYDVQPSSRALVIYALSCSVVLAGATLWLERWVRKQERRNREQASAALRERRDHTKERIAVKEVKTLGNGGQPASGGGFSANTHETALYILRKQQKCEKILRGREDEEDKREMEERKKRQRSVRHSPSPSTQLVSPVSLATTASPLLSPPHSAVSLVAQQQSVDYGSSMDGTVSPSPPFTSSSMPTTPLFSPLWSDPSPINATSIPFLSSPSDPLLPSSSVSSSSSQSSVHRSILSTTFLTQYYIAIASTLCQGFALLVAYSWVGVFSLVLFPALRRWSVLMDVTDVAINAVWSAATFVIYFMMILLAARIFHRDEAFEL